MPRPVSRTGRDTEENPHRIRTSRFRRPANAILKESEEKRIRTSRFRRFHRPANAIRKESEEKTICTESAQNPHKLLPPPSPPPPPSQRDPQKIRRKNPARGESRDAPQPQVLELIRRSLAPRTRTAPSTVRLTQFFHLSFSWGFNSTVYGPTIRFFYRVSTCFFFAFFFSSFFFHLKGQGSFRYFYLVLPSFFLISSHSLHVFTVFVREVFTQQSEMSTLVWFYSFFLWFS